jgi:hypothetical protein
MIRFVRCKEVTAKDSILRFDLLEPRGPESLIGDDDETTLRRQHLLEDRLYTCSWTFGFPLLFTECTSSYSASDRPLSATLFTKTKIRQLNRSPFLRQGIRAVDLTGC